MAKIGELLIEKGIITQAQLDQALAEQSKTGDRLGDLIVALGFASKEQVEALF
jgi:MSHA biogenesis protein MshE